MKKLLLSLAAGLVVLQAAAGDGKWLTDVPKAQEIAKKESKHVLLDFTGSDWCPPCKKLHKDVLTSEEFEKFASEKLVLVELDFPNNKPQSDELKKANQALQSKYDISGYPTLILLNSEGKEVWRNVGYGGEKPKDFIAKMSKGLK